jgi:hypothetical protein
MTDLIVPIPTWTVEGESVPLVRLDKPIEVLCGPATFDSERSFTMEDLGRTGFFVYRQLSAFAQEEIWNEAIKSWQPPGALDPAPEPTAFAPNPASPGMWKGILVAAGQEDSSDQPKFSKATPDFPRYTLRAYFSSRSPDTLSGLSGPSLPIRFISLQDAILAGLRIPDDETPETAEEIRYFLRVGASDVAWVQLQRSGSGAEIEVSNSAGASLRLLPTGDIMLSPAAGRHIFIEGPTEMEGIFYQPSDAAGNPSGTKRWLT